MLKQAVIQAGGKGTRLGELTRLIPKPLVEVAGKPVLEYQLEWCTNNGVEQIIIVVNHLGHIIEEYLEKVEKKFNNLSIQLIKEPSALGTAGIFPEIEDQLDEEFLVLYGDVLFDIDLKRMLSFHKQHNADATLVIHPNDHPHDSDLVELDEDQKVLRFLSKPHVEGLQYQNLVNAALYILNKKIIPSIPKGVSTDFGKNIFPEVVKEFRVFGYSTPEFLKDMGTPDRRGAVEEAVVSGKVKRRNLNTRQKAIFLDRDGVLNYDTDLIHRPEDFQLYDYTASSLKRINKSDYLSVITTNQSVVARNLTDLDGLRKIHNKMETELGHQGAFVDAIYFCPHHPDKGFPGENPEFKIVCDCRKPKPGMIMKATERFNINLKKSWIIGDSARDIGSGIAAGVRTVGVKTGHGLKNSKLEPDFFFTDFKEAVDFILDNPMESVVEEIVNRIPEKEEPTIVLIAGNSRSGKTHLTRMLEFGLEEDETSYFTIHLDDWILHKSKRKPNSDVYGNFNFGQIQQDIPKILKGETVELNGYTRHTERPERHVKYAYEGQKVIIIEGVVSFSDETWREMADLKVFVTCSPEEHFRRIQKFYEWKGTSQEDIEAQYKVRQHNEYDVINRLAIHADILHSTD